MSIIKLARRSRYTVINNALIEDKRLDFDHVGLLTYLLSKRSNWNISVAHLAKQKKSGASKINRLLKELQKFGYAKYQRLPTGKTEWTIYEKPHVENQDKAIKPHVENPHVEKPHVANRTLVITDKESKYLNNSKKENKQKKFKKPTVEEINDYQIEYKNKILIDADYFIDYYESNGWKIKNNPMKDWKATVRNWIRNQNNFKVQKNAKRETNADRVNRAVRELLA